MRRRSSRRSHDNDIALSCKCDLPETSEICGRGDGNDIGIVAESKIRSRARDALRV